MANNNPSCENQPEASQAEEPRKPGESSLIGGGTDMTTSNENARDKTREGCYTLREE
jgi:hypothetical protein